jgi:hypothetical protein
MKVVNYRDTGNPKEQILCLNLSIGAWNLTGAQPQDVLVGWNKRSAVPADVASLTIRIAGTAPRLFQPTARDFKTHNLQGRAS